MPALAEHILLLYLHILTQYTRTKYAHEQMKEKKQNLENTLNGIIIDEETKNGLRDIENNVAEICFFSAIRNYPFLLDMHWLLGLNQTKEEFVTSDNPVILYNQFLYFDNQLSNNVGFVTAGLQIFYPINPKQMIILFDPSCYSAKAAKSLIKIDSRKDVIELNTLQMCAALNNVYTHKNTDVSALYRKAKPFLRKAKTRYSCFTEYENEDERSDILINSPLEIKTHLKLSFMKLKRTAKKRREKLVQRKALFPPPIRNEKHRQDAEEFIEKVDTGQYEMIEFSKFILDKYPYSK